jgi:hypothetical protein
MEDTRGSKPPPPKKKHDQKNKVRLDTKSKLKKKKKARKDTQRCKDLLFERFSNQCCIGTSTPLHEHFEIKPGPRDREKRQMDRNTLIHDQDRG